MTRYGSNVGGAAVVKRSTVRSADGTDIAVETVGASGTGLVVVGGVLSSAADYLPLARRLASKLQVHVINRRGRPGSGPMADRHSLDDECDDVASVAAATGASIVFGHSFGGLIALEAARRSRVFDTVVVYDAAVSLRGSFDLHWLEGYAGRLRAGDRRGAFAWMVRHNGFSPRAMSMLPAPAVDLLLRGGVRGARWARLDPLLEANLTEHAILEASDDATAVRFSSIAAPTTLLVGARSPAPFHVAVEELVRTVPSATAVVVSRVGHSAPQSRPRPVAAAVIDALVERLIRTPNQPLAPPDSV